MFCAGLFLLAKGADVLVRGAEDLAVRAGVSPATIGLTVVAFGTSLPELVVSTEAFRQGDYAIGTGNLVGSNIANIGLILATALILVPAAAGIGEVRSRLRVNALLMLGAALAFALLSLRGYFDLLSGIVFLSVFFAMLLLMWRSGSVPVPPPGPRARHPLFLTGAGLAMVFLGSPLLLSGAVEIAGIFSIPPAVIGLSMVAVGTSLPELATSLVAAIRRSHGVAIGNLLGSNIFNLLFIMGVNSLFFPIPAADLNDTLVMIGFSIAFFPALIRNDRWARPWGCLLLGAYLLYTLFLYGIA